MPVVLGWKDIALIVIEFDFVPLESNFLQNHSIAIQVWHDLVAKAFVEVIETDYSASYCSTK